MKVEGAKFRHRPDHFTTTAPPTTPNEKTHPLNQMLDYVQYQVPKEELAAALWAGAVIIGTDGSVKNGHGTYAL